MKKFLIALLCVVLAVVLAVGGYVAYVFIAYYRLDDALPLTVDALGDAAGSPAAGETYRLASYNVGFGAYSADYSFFMDGGKESRARSPEAVRENLTGAVEAVTALDPDFLLMQEIDTGGTRSHHIDELALIREQLGGAFVCDAFAQNYDSPYLFWPLTEPHGANKAGIAVFSKFPVSSALRRSLPIEGGFMKFLDLDRCYSVQRVPAADGRELVIYNFHLSAYTSDGTIANQQLEMLFADMKAEYDAGNWTIAAGDFNKDLVGDGGASFGVTGPEYTWAQPIPASIVPEGFSIVAPYDEAAPIPSCRNADRPYGEDDFCVTVDGFIVSANVGVEEAAVADTGFAWSDHNPVYLDFTLN